MKKLLLLVIVISVYSQSLFAADAAPASAMASPPNVQNSSDPSLKDQLQVLQEAILSSDVSSHVKPTQQTQGNQAQKNPQPKVVPPTNVVQGTNAAASPTTPPSTADPNSVASTVPEMTDVDALQDQAFGRVIANTLPLSPAQIQMLKTMYDETQKVAATSAGIPARPTSTSVVVNLSPGATPPIVRLAAGFVTSMVFVDATGSPWPIDSYSLGNPSAFNIQWDKKSNILLMQAITAYRRGNLAVLLKGLNTPVMLDLTPGQTAMDERVDLRIPALGPNAKVNYNALPGKENPALLSLLDGVPPPGAVTLKSSACDNCAWLLGERMFLRTQYNVLSPAWISTMSSADGTHVYEMSPTPIVLVTFNGKMIKMRIEGF